MKYVEGTVRGDVSRPTCHRAVRRLRCNRDTLLPFLRIPPCISSVGKRRSTRGASFSLWLIIRSSFAAFRAGPPRINFRPRSFMRISAFFCLPLQLPLPSHPLSARLNLDAEAIIIDREEMDFFLLDYRICRNSMENLILRWSRTLLIVHSDFTIEEGKANKMEFSVLLVPLNFIACRVSSQIRWQPITCHRLTGLTSVLTRYIYICFFFNEITSGIYSKSIREKTFIRLINSKFCL